MDDFTREITAALGAAFPLDEIEFLPRAQSNGKALALAYIDARSVMRRLDAAVGPANWSFDFDLLDQQGKMVKGRLTVLGVTKCDAGEAAQEDEPLKSAVSDALKRCAVHFGVGRYLYYLPRVWAPYDAQKRRFTETPRLEARMVEDALRICGVGTAEARPSGQERAAAAVRSAERPLAPAGEPESSGDRAAKFTGRKDVCAGDRCGTKLTERQAAVSIQAFGEPLCPACQKDRARARSGT
jgi:hypothetical protein